MPTQSQAKIGRTQAVESTRQNQIVFQIVQDAVHGVIELEPLAVQLIDSPEFQRLREIKQLGIACFVFPSCQHSRFEHSIGTYHMAKKLLETIHCDQNYSGPTLSFPEQLAVKIAALCHDLGHGPFSHLWEEFIKRGGPEYNEYNHETISGHVLHHIVHSKPSIHNELHNLGVDMNLIRSLILGDSCTVLSNQASLKDKPFIYEILSNSSNGMDVDKWDYLLRDCLHAGLGASGTSVDINRFLRFYRPFLHTDKGNNSSQNGSQCWHLSFRDTELENLLRTFSLRQHLHQKVYQHKTVTAISAMVIDALELIEPVLNLRSISMKALRCQNPEDLDNFLKLHDSLLWDIYYERGSLSKVTSNDFLSRVQQAQSLIRRILNRELYLYIDSIYEMAYYAPSDENSNYQYSTDLEKLPDFVNEVATESLTLRSMGLGLGPKKSLCYEPISLKYRTFGATSNNKSKHSKESMRNEIFKRLPQESGVKDINDLLVTESRFTSNSTPKSPIFYFYTRSGSTFTYSEPLRVIRAYRLYWRRIDFPLKSATSRSVICLTEAFNQWHQEMIEDRHGVKRD
ncbi:Deoxynucleoside triphosphate triphosphohydrolase SAMHD1 isoform 2 [Schistosoma japonicum]|uniref:Deoxynucleoside triphosphate triphosphohydrolase SAMHD1 isoform 2 n=1 Tax=Schistosoma japonicum TaxID=6182 RepID=A0A4Z2CTN5_SCHJA|nr:Deoxynucleoside triphosphate triphosphohydrolase SAMHD1 isoform 2 [Schistosoma japonicum]